jgi:predicted N-acyltransferase
VMERAEVKLETLNQPFFENLYANMKDDIKVLAMVKSKEVLGAAILTISEKTMTFLLVGLDYSRRDQYEVYFNLVYGIISLAIERGSTRLDLGQTSYWLKQRIGGVCIPEYVYIKANRWYAHYGLKTLRSVIFPEMTLLNPRAFRE